MVACPRRTEWPCRRTSKRKSRKDKRTHPPKDPNREVCGAICENKKDAFVIISLFWRRQEFLFNLVESRQNASQFPCRVCNFGWASNRSESHKPRSNIFYGSYAHASVIRLALNFFWFVLQYILSHHYLKICIFFILPSLPSRPLPKQYVRIPVVSYTSICYYYIAS